MKIKIKYLGFWSIQICSWVMLAAIILLSSCGSVRKVQSSKSSFVVADTTGKQSATEQTIVKEDVIMVKGHRDYPHR